MKKAFVYGFTLILLVGSVMNLVYHTDRTVSQSENRALQTFPAFSLTDYLSGEYTQSLDRYVSDQFAFRDTWLSLSRHLDAFRGLPAADVEIISLENENTGQVQTPEAQTETPAAPRESQLIITDTLALSNHIANPEGERHYAEALNRFARSHPDLTILSMLPPTKVSFYLPEDYADLSDDEQASVKHISGLLDPAIRFIDVYDAIDAHQSEYLYLRTDHHWTALGAYYAYTIYAQSLGLPIFDLADTDEVIVENFLGSLYKMSQSETIAGYPDTLIGYAPRIGVEMVTDNDRIDREVVGFFGYGTANYGMFLNGDAALKVIRSDSPTAEGKLLIVKDSYANAFIPYLVYDYAEIHVIDPRHYAGLLDDYLEATGIDTVLFFNSAAIAKYNSYHDVLAGVFGEVE